MIGMPSPSFWTPEATMRSPGFNPDWTT